MGKRAGTSYYQKVHFLIMVRSDHSISAHAIIFRNRRRERAYMRDNVGN